MQYLRQCYPRADRAGLKEVGGEIEKGTFNVSCDPQFFRTLFVTRPLLLPPSLIARLLRYPNNVVMREIILALLQIACICMESHADKNDSVTR